MAGGTLVAEMVRNRWFVLVICVWIQAVSGASYNFSIYSGVLKTAMGYDQHTLDTLGWFKDLGESVGILSGLLYDYFPPWGVLLIGAAQNFYGYTMLWMAVTGQIAQPALWKMCCYMCIGANGQTYLHTAVMVTSVKSFPLSRGVVLGIMKGLSGLSGAIMTQIWMAVYGADNPSQFLLMVSWLATMVPLTLMFVLRPVEPPERREPEEDRNLVILTLLILGLCGYLMAVILVEDTMTLGVTIVRIVASVTILLLLLPLGVPLKSVYRRQPSSSLQAPLLLPDPETGKAASTSGKLVVTTTPCQADLEKQLEAPPSPKPRPQRGEDFSLTEALTSADFWLILFATSCGIGSGLTAIDNLSQVGTSLGYSQSQVQTFVSLVSIWNFLGRIAGGSLSELALHRHGTPRPTFIILTLAVLAFGHMVMSVGFSGGIYLGSVSIGMSYGALMAIIPTTTSEIFGLRNFGTLLNLVSVSNPVSAYFFSVQIAGCVYDMQAQKQATSVAQLTVTQLVRKRMFRKRLFSGVPRLFSSADASDELLCTGPLCFRITFTIMAMFCVAGALAGIALYKRTSKFYRIELFRRCNSTSRSQADSEEATVS